MQSKLRSFIREINCHLFLQHCYMVHIMISNKVETFEFDVKMFENLNEMSCNEGAKKNI